MAPLATAAELETFTGETYVQARADMALEQASAAVRLYCGWHIAPSQVDTVTVDGSGATVQGLPTLHLTAVASITEDDTAVDVTGIEWSAAGFLKRSTAWTCKLRGVTAQITHGYLEVPPEVREIVLTAAARGLATPAGGVVRDQEQVGDYSRNVQYSTVGQNQAAGGSLLPHELTVLDRYAIANPA